MLEAVIVLAILIVTVLAVFWLVIAPVMLVSEFLWRVIARIIRWTEE